MPGIFGDVQNLCDHSQIHDISKSFTNPCLDISVTTKFFFMEIWTSKKSMYITQNFYVYNLVSKDCGFVVISTVTCRRNIKVLRKFLIKASGLYELSISRSFSIIFSTTLLLVNMYFIITFSSYSISRCQHFLLVLILLQIFQNLYLSILFLVIPSIPSLSTPNIGLFKHVITIKYIYKQSRQKTV